MGFTHGLTHGLMDGKNMFLGFINMGLSETHEPKKNM
jgi:hypothetical protein